MRLRIIGTIAVVAVLAAAAARAEPVSAHPNPARQRKD